MKRSAKIAIGSVVAVVVLVAAVYGAGVFYFNSHLFPNTKLGNQDVSLQSERQLASGFNSVASNYALDISGLGFSYKLDSSKIDMSIEGASLASDALSRQDSVAWPIELLASHDLSDLLSVSYDEAKLKSVVKNQVKIYNQEKTASENATVVYDESSAAYTVKPEVVGNQFKNSLVFAKVKDAIDSLQDDCSLSESELATPEIISGDERLTAAAEKGNSLLAGTIKLVTSTDHSDVASITKDQICKWVSFSADDLDMKVDDNAIEEWLGTSTSGLNTVGSKRKWKRADGTKCTVEGGSYGWKVDATGIEKTIASQLKKVDFTDIEVTCSKKAATYAGAGKRDWKAYVDIDLSEQKVRYYDDDDKLKFETKCVTGTKGKHDTPKGVYTIDWRQSPRVLKGENDNGTKYESRVTYWLPFIDSRGIGLHDASWRSTFGGNIWKTSGSHGCVNLPTASAKWFYENLPSGTVVVVHS